MHRRVRTFLVLCGVAIGLAWGGLLANFAAGAFLMLLRPFKVGDAVMAAGVTGTVDAIGLFGTVVGIMIAFQRIGATGSTNLAIVAPGISEALIATAAGLFAAIPALVFYNHFTHRVKEFSATMDDFALEFLNIAERNFT